MDNAEHNPKLTSESLQTFVPPTKKPNVRTDRSNPPHMDVYGLRPLESPWRLLSPHEFMQNWTAELLHPPYYYDRRRVHRRTEWTAEGEKLYRSDAFKDPNSKVILFF